MPKQEQPQKSGSKPDRGAWPNEGEGSKSAARNYDAATEQYAKSGRVPKAAEEAKRALEGPEADDLRRAEEKGKSKRADS